MFDERESNLTPVSKLGEFGLIDKLTEDFTVHHGAVYKHVGDDAAVYQAEEGWVHLVSTDLLCEGVHFDLAYVPLRHLGFKAVAVNVSDIVAMNGDPFGITVSIAFSNRFPVEALEELYEGIRIACKEYKVDLLGGDTSSSRAGLIISVTALGRCPSDAVTYRSGAKQNDVICVSGNLGAAYAGLQILEREKQVFTHNPEMQPDLVGYDYVVGRQLKPEARIDIMRSLQLINVQPTSMIDISDGLASELFHICRQSGLGARIYEDKIPVDHQTGIVAEEFGIHPMTYALNGGEDYELLFTVKLEDLEAVRSIPDVFVIGYMSAKDDGLLIVNPAGQEHPLQAQGWNHFNQP